MAETGSERALADSEIQDKAWHAVREVTKYEWYCPECGEGCDDFLTTQAQAQEQAEHHYRAECPVYHEDDA